jgi:tetratricopeptide (TPR) repeat protein
LLALQVLAWPQPPAREKDLQSQLLGTVLTATESEEAVGAGLQLARKCRDNGQVALAEACLRELVSRHPTCRPAEVKFELGYLLFGQFLQRRPEAVYWFRQAVEQGQDDPVHAARAQLFVGYTYGEQGEFDRAKVEFAKVKELFPAQRRQVAQATSDYLCFRHWRAPHPEGLLSEALTARQEFADLPDLAGVVDMVCGRLATRLGRSEEALAFFERVPATLNFPAAKGVDAAGEAVLCHLQLGDLPQAQSAVESLFQRFPEASKQEQFVRLRELVRSIAAGEGPGSLKVIVLEKETGQAVPFALVMVGQDNHWWWQRHADAKGSVTISPLPPGPAVLLAEAAPLRPVGLNVTVTKGPQPTVVEVLMGRSFSARRLRLLGPEGRPLSNLDVQSWQGQLNRGSVHWCDDDGVVSLPYFAEGTQKLDCLLRVPGIGVAAFDLVGTEDGAAVRLQPGGGVEGSAEEGGAPASPGILVAASTPTVTFYTVTDATGKFSFRQLPPGECKISLADGQTGRLVTENMPTVVLAEGKIVADLKLPVKAP